MRVALVGLLLSSTPALADGLLSGPALGDGLVDFQLLFQQNANDVVESKDAAGNRIRFLDLGDGVSVRCVNDDCVESDMNGAVGCVWAVATDLRVLAEICEVPTDPKIEALLGFQARISAYVAANAVPPRSLEEMENRFQERVLQLRSKPIQAIAVICERAAPPDSAEMGSLDKILSATPEELEAALAKPRLPAMHPCL